jgi:hypothetical protein
MHIIDVYNCCRQLEELSVAVRFWSPIYFVVLELIFLIASQTSAAFM